MDGVRGRRHGGRLRIVWGRVFLVSVTDCMQVRGFMNLAIKDMVAVAGVTCLLDAREP